MSEITKPARKFLVRYGDSVLPGVHTTPEEAQQARRTATLKHIRRDLCDGCGANGDHGYSVQTGGE